MSKFLDSTGLTYLWNKINTALHKYINSLSYDAATRVITGSCFYKETTGLKKITISTITLPEATTTNAGLLSSTNYNYLYNNLNPYQYIKTGTTSNSYVSLFTINNANTINSSTYYIPCVVEFDLYVAYGAYPYAGCLFHCTLCLGGASSSTAVTSVPTLTYNVKYTNGANPTAAGIITGITVDRTNKVVYAKVNSSSSYLASCYFITTVYPRFNCTVSNATTTSPTGTTTDFNL